MAVERIITNFLSYGYIPSVYISNEVVFVGLSHHTYTVFLGAVLAHDFERFVLAAGVTDTCLGLSDPTVNYECVDLHCLMNNLQLPNLLLQKCAITESFQNQRHIERE